MTKTSFLRNVAKMLVACLAVVVMFVACEPNNGNGNNGNNGNKTSGTEWPPSEVRSQYGLKEMGKPTGASGIAWSNYGALIIYFTGTDATRTAVCGSFVAGGWIKNEKESYEFVEQKIYGYLYEKGEYEASYEDSQGNMRIQAKKKSN